MSSECEICHCYVVIKRHMNAETIAHHAMAFELKVRMQQNYEENSDDFSEIDSLFIFLTLNVY